MRKELLTRFMEKRVAELEKEQRNGTAHVYQNALNRLENFMNRREITFNQLTPRWSALFGRKLLADQLKWDTIPTYIRILRSVYNQASKRDVTTYMPHLFNKIHTNIDYPARRAVSPEVIYGLVTNRKPLPGKLTFGRDLFVLLFLLREMPFADLAFLRRCDLQGNVITYHQRKTSRKPTVVVGKETMGVIQRYICTDPDSPYLFPIMRNPDRDEYGQYARMLRLQGYRLTQVARVLGIRDRLSTYTAHHAWATATLRQNYNSGLICDTMRHSSVKVTETYFQPCRNDEVNRMNSSLITYILSKKKRGIDKSSRD